MSGNCMAHTRMWCQHTMCPVMQSVCFDMGQHMYAHCLAGATAYSACMRVHLPRPHLLTRLERLSVQAIRPSSPQLTSRLASLGTNVQPVTLAWWWRREVEVVVVVHSPTAHGQQDR